jgi:hypothetical protein
MPPRTTSHLRIWIIITLGWLVVLSLMGVLLRFMTVIPVSGIVYGNFLHGHSHVAFLGWIFNALFILIVYHYNLEESYPSFFHRLFIALQICVVGMMILFPMQGYKAASITVSAIHTFLTFIFAWRLFTCSNPICETGQKHGLSFSIMMIALVFMIISSLGPFALGPLVANDMKNTIWYSLAIYFYLYFQFNGWFYFAIIGLFFWFMEFNHVPFSNKRASYFIVLNVAAVILTYVVSTLWVSPPWWVYILSITGSTLQLYSLYILFSLIKPIWNHLRSTFTNTVRLLVIVVFFSLCLKCVLQLVGSFPAAAELASHARHLVISYLHLNFIGIISLFLMALFIQNQWILMTRVAARFSLLLFLISFLISELVLVLPSLSVFFAFRGYHEILFWLSVLMAMGLFGWTLHFRRPVQQ